MLFPEPGELDLLRDAGLHIRKDCQFHWHNERLRIVRRVSRDIQLGKRKKTVVTAGGLPRQASGFAGCAADDLMPDAWHIVYRLISMTFMRAAHCPISASIFQRRSVVYCRTTSSSSWPNGKTPRSQPLFFYE